MLATGAGDTGAGKAGAVDAQRLAAPRLGSARVGRNQHTPCRLLVWQPRCTRVPARQASPLRAPACCFLRRCILRHRPPPPPHSPTPSLTAIELRLRADRATLLEMLTQQLYKRIRIIRVEPVSAFDFVEMHTRIV